MIEKLENEFQKVYSHWQARYGKNRNRWPDYANGECDGYQACISAFKRGILK